MKSLLFAAALLLAAPTARAEGPVGPPEGGDPMEEIKKAARKVTEGMKESEAALSRLARGEKVDPKGVDIELPGDGDPPPPPSSPPGAGGSLERSAEQGRQVVDGINRIIENAARMGGQSSGGGGGGKPRPTDGDDEKDGEKQRNAKKEQEEKKDPLKDDHSDGGKDPKDGQKKDPKESQESKDKAPPPPSPTAKPGPRDPNGVFFAQLPAKVREAVLAGDFDQVPERYRDLIREWTKKLAEKEAAEAAR